MENKTLAGIGGVDTCYYFIETGNNYSIFYQDMVSRVEAEEGLYGYSYLGSSKGFHWFEKYDADLKDEAIYRIGFKDPDKQRNVNNVWVQLDGRGIYYYGLKKLVDLVAENLPFEIRSQQIQRIDVNYFVNKNLDELKYEYFETRLRNNLKIKDEHSKEFRKGVKLETLYLGSPKASFMVRIYNKKKEMEMKTNYKKILLENYMTENGLDLDAPIWNIEFQYKREELLKYKIETVEDAISSANNLLYEGLHRCRLLDYKSEKYEKYYPKHKELIMTDPTWRQITIDVAKKRLGNLDRKTEKQYKRSFKEMKKRIYQEIATYNRYADKQITLEDLMISMLSDLAENAIDEILDDDEANYIPVYFQDKEGRYIYENIKGYLKQKKYLIPKYANDDKLIEEAELRFGKIRKKKTAV